MKKIVLAVSLCVLLGCVSSRQTRIEKEETVSTIEQVHTVKTDGTKISDISLNYEFDKQEYEFSPIDPLKPMKIGSNEYYNTKIKSSKHKEKGESKIKDSTVLKTESNTKTLEKKKSALKRKEIDKKGQNFIVWYIITTFIITLLIYLFNYFKNKYKQKNPLL